MRQFPAAPASWERKGSWGGFAGACQHHLTCSRQDTLSRPWSEIDSSVTSWKPDPARPGCCLCQGFLGTLLSLPTPPWEQC